MKKSTRKKPTPARIVRHVSAGRKHSAEGDTGEEVASNDDDSMEDADREGEDMSGDDSGDGAGDDNGGGDGGD